VTGKLATSYGLTGNYRQTALVEFGLYLRRSTNAIPIGYEKRAGFSHACIYIDALRLLGSYRTEKIDRQTDRHQTVALQAYAAVYADSENYRRPKRSVEHRRR